MMMTSSRSYVIQVKPNVFVLLPPSENEFNKLENNRNKDWILANMEGSKVVSVDLLPPTKEIILWSCTDMNGVEQFLLVFHELVPAAEINTLVSNFVQNRMHSVCKVQPMRVKKE